MEKTPHRVSFMPQPRRGFNGKKEGNAGSLKKPENTRGLRYLRKRLCFEKNEEGEGISDLVLPPTYFDFRRRQRENLYKRENNEGT